MEGGDVGLLRRSPPCSPRAGRERWRGGAAASCASSSVMPAWTSTTRRIRSASATARSACRAASASMPRRAAQEPRRVHQPEPAAAPGGLDLDPVARDARACRARSPRDGRTSRFTSVDLPTFCRPTMATVGQRARSPHQLRCARRTTASAASSVVAASRSVVSITTASAAGSSGCRPRVARSRARAAPRPRRVGAPAPPRAGRPARPAARRRNSFTGASGNTTEPMSRPSMTAPAAPSARCARTHEGADLRVARDRRDRRPRPRASCSSASVRNPRPRARRGRRRDGRTSTSA